MKLKSKTIAYATARKRKMRGKEETLIKEIELLEKENLTSEQEILLKEKNTELIKIREKRVEGIVLRSRARWIADGEKISKYFCNLEKRHYTNKNMNKLLGYNGRTIDEPHEIIREVNTFYRTLYTKRNVKTCEIKDLINELPRLSAEETKSLEGEITFEEAGLALKSMSNGKSPGTDGFGAEFFKFFWKKLGPYVVRALNQSFRDGELSATQKEGIITCIPKTDKPKEFIKNWRPISLFNVLYKIGATCMANRIKVYLPQFINED